jgi:hypothetical protein
MGSNFFLGGVGGGGGGGPRGGAGFFCLFGSNVFSSYSHGLPQAPKLFPKTFPITPQFYTIWFAQSSILMYINWKSGPKGNTFVSILWLGFKEVFLVGRAQCSKNNWWWVNQCASSKRKEKRCECTHEQININHNMFIFGVLFLFSQFLLVQTKLP